MAPPKTRLEERKRKEVPFEPDEWKEVEKSAKREGLTTTEFCRQAVLKALDKPPPKRKR